MTRPLVGRRTLPKPLPLEANDRAYLNLCAFRSSGLVLAGLTLALLMGCAVRRPIGMTFAVAPACLLSPVELVGCDAGSPPRCKTARVSYRRGCETLQPAR